MEKSKLLIETLNGNTPNRPPFWFMRQAGRYLPEYREVRAQAGGFLDLCFNPELAVEVTLQPIRRFGMDAAILFADILLIPLALGVDVVFEAGEGPRLGCVNSTEKVEALHFDPRRLEPIYQTLKLVKPALPSHVSLIGFAGSPWTVACYMVEGKASRDFHATREFACQRGDVFAALLNTLVDATIIYLRAQIEAGAEVLQLFDSWSGVLSEAEFERYVIEPTRRIVLALKESHPHIPLIGFPRRAGMLALQYARKTGVQGISLDEGWPVEEAAEKLQPKTVIQGNLDPILLKNDLPAALKQAKHIREILGRNPFIFNLGHGILQHTPIEHVQALSEYLREEME